MNKFLKSTLCFGILISSIGLNTSLASEKKIKYLNNVNKG